jgi:hypothetical protein
LIEELVVCDPLTPVAVVAEAELPGAPPGRTVRLVLDLGYATDEAATLVRDLTAGLATQIEATLTDPATDLSAELAAALVALAGALAQQPADRATVTTLNTPLARAWHAHPAGLGR